MNSRKKTLENLKNRRPTQICKTIELKIDQSFLNKKEKEALKMMFVEAKWCYNHILGSGINPFEFDYKTLQTIKVKTLSGFEDREIKFLSERNKQDILFKMKKTIVLLSKLKKLGHRVGHLRFKNEIKYIMLYEYGKGRLNGTHKIVGKNRVKINKIKRPLKVSGLDQIPPHVEFGFATLYKRGSGYYILQTIYENKKSNNLKKETLPDVGLDFGIKTNVTTSEGEVFNCKIQEPETLKRLQRRFSRSTKGSKNRNKLKIKIQKKYEKIVNKKKDLSNKFIAGLLKRYQNIYFQDESLSAWKSKGFGKQVSSSCLGLIKENLQRLSGRAWKVQKYFPSTKLCYSCGKENVLSLAQRQYKCDCGLEEDRDVKAAKTILLFGQSKIAWVPTEHRDVKPAKNPAPILDLRDKLDSKKQEALSQG